MCFQISTIFPKCYLRNICRTLNIQTRASALSADFALVPTQSIFPQFRPHDLGFSSYLSASFLTTSFLSYFRYHCYSVIHPSSSSCPCMLMFPECPLQTRLLHHSEPPCPKTGYLKLSAVKSEILAAHDSITQDAEAEGSQSIRPAWTT